MDSSRRAARITTHKWNNSPPAAETLAGQWQRCFSCLFMSCLVFTPRFDPVMTMLGRRATIIRVVLSPDIAGGVLFFGSLKQKVFYFGVFGWGVLRKCASMWN